MPALVTAADHPLARRIAARLLDDGGEVRVFAASETTALRAAGAFVAIGSPDDEGKLEAALEDVHTVVHADAARWDAEPARIAADAAVVATAAANAGVRRIVMLSLPGASVDAEQAHRRAAGQAETRLTAVDCPTVVIRASLIDTPDLRDALATGGLGEEALATEVAPVRAGDLADLVVAFDRARARSRSGHLLVRAEGPERRSVAHYLERVGVAPAGRGSLMGRRIVTDARAAQLTDWLDGPWWSDTGTTVDGWEFAGLTPAPPGPGA